MVYERLSKIFYKLESPSFQEEVIKRKNDYGSYLTSLKIRGFRKGLTDDVYELFYVNTNELMSLNNKVLLNSSKISSLINKLPPIVVKPYFDKLVINEAQSNNEIEGIRSTKRELKEALSELEQSEPKNKRFIGLMKTYRYIDEIKPFKHIQDFRDLYDNLVADEITEEYSPDGKLFRKGSVEVTNGTTTTHIGVFSEEKIIESLGNLINFLDDESHPELYRYMVAHYYYEYIHPFYDGNGRTGRLIVGSYLSRYLDRYSAITFSYAVNKDKAKYYKSLEEIPFPLNQGEMTFYLINMLELLVTGQEGIIEDLELNLMKLNKIMNHFELPEWKIYKYEQELLNTIVLLNVFVDEEIIFTTKDLMFFVEKSRHIVDKSMKYLTEKEFIKVINNYPKTYKICDGFLDSILLS